MGSEMCIRDRYKINKKNSLDFFYRYQNHADDDETNGHVVGAGYTFKF